MHTPKNAILTIWEMEAAMIVSIHANLQKMRNIRDMYHGNAAMIVPIGREDKKIIKIYSIYFTYII